MMLVHAAWSHDVSQRMVVVGRVVVELAYHHTIITTRTYIHLACHLATCGARGRVSPIVAINETCFLGRA